MPPSEYSSESLADRKRVRDEIRKLEQAAREERNRLPWWRWLRRRELAAQIGALIDAWCTCLSVRESWSESLTEQIRAQSLLPTLIGTDPDSLLVEKL